MENSEEVTCEKDTSCPITPAETGSAKDGLEKIRQLMLERLSVTNAHFAHRQRDAPDLTQQEKIDIASDILRKNPAKFLARFGKFLHASDLLYFGHTKAGDQERDYEVQFYVKEISNRCAHSDVIVKNRRFAAMQELEASGVYFSEEEMKNREPLLYEQMIGQYMTENEKKVQAENAFDRSDLRFSTVLLSFMDIAEQKMLYKNQKDNEDGQKEEEEDDDDDESDNIETKQKTGVFVDDDDSDLAEDPPDISDVRATEIWRQQQRDEFKTIMHEKFMSGADNLFDYSQVDNNPDYDSLATLAQDEEQNYFLSEDPQDVDHPDTSDNSMDADHSDAGVNSVSADQAASKLNGTGYEEVDDYMMYEPSPELVAKSAQFVKLGCWSDKNDDL